MVALVGRSTHQAYLAVSIVCKRIWLIMVSSDLAHPRAEKAELFRYSRDEILDIGGIWESTAARNHLKSASISNQRQHPAHRGKRGGCRLTLALGKWGRSESSCLNERVRATICPTGVTRDMTPPQDNAIWFTSQLRTHPPAPSPSSLPLLQNLSHTTSLTSTLLPSLTLKNSYMRTSKLTTLTLL